MKIYIISYLGKENIFEKRLAVHNKQLDWCFKLGLEPVVLANHYPSQDIKRKGVTYFDCGEEEVVLQNPAKNILLEKFYASDDDWCILADNDTILYDHGSPETCLISTFNKMPLTSSVGLVTVVDPMHQPFTQYHTEQKDLLSEYLAVERHLLPMSFTIIKNFRKASKPEIYFDPTCWYSEEWDFAFQCIKNGCGSYRIKNWVLKRLTTVDSQSTFAVLERMTRKEAIDQGLEIIFNKWKDFGLTRGGKTNWDTSSFLKTYWKTPTKFVIKKETGVEKPVNKLTLNSVKQQETKLF